MFAVEPVKNVSTSETAGLVKVVTACDGVFDVAPVPSVSVAVVAVADAVAGATVAGAAGVGVLRPQAVIRSMVTSTRAIVFGITLSMA